MRDVTQQALADAIGVGKSAISKAENMETNPPLLTLVAVAKALKIPVGDLFHPPPSTARAQLLKDLQSVNEEDIDPVASLVRSIIQMRSKKRA